MYFTEKVTETDIINLLNSNTPEQKTLEYKRQLPDKNKDDQKTKILQSIASFANSDGGIIIFGIKEKEGGGASEIINIESSTDNDFLQLHEIVKNKIVPRMSPPDLYELIIDGKKIYIMKILPSYTKPHYVNDNYIFYGRNNSGKYQLDISDIRSLFLRSKTVEEQFENFKLQRIMKLKSGNFPFKYDSDSIVTLHIASLSSLNNEVQLSMSKLKYQFKDFVPLYSNSSYGSYNNGVNNYDGCLNYTYTKESKMYSYVQIFRNGIIEASTFGMFEHSEDKIIFGSQIEQDTKSAIIEYIKILEKYDITFPFFITISILNSKGYKLVGNNRYIHDDFDKIFIDDILLPTIFVEDGDDLNCKLDECYDILWNANGYSGSPNAAREN